MTQNYLYLMIYSKVLRIYKSKLFIIVLFFLTSSNGLLAQEISISNSLPLLSIDLDVTSPEYFLACVPHKIKVVSMDSNFFLKFDRLEYRKINKFEYFIYFTSGVDTSTQYNSGKVILYRFEGNDSVKVKEYCFAPVDIPGNVYLNCHIRNGSSLTSGRLKDELKSNMWICYLTDETNYSLRWPVLSFGLVTKKGMLYSKSEFFTKEQLRYIKKLKKGDFIVIKDVVYKNSINVRVLDVPTVFFID